MICLRRAHTKGRTGAPGEGNRARMGVAEGGRAAIRARPLQERLLAAHVRVKEPIGHPFPSDLIHKKIQSRVFLQMKDICQPCTYLKLEYPRGFRVGGGGGSAPSREHVNALGLLIAVWCKESVWNKNTEVKNRVCNRQRGARCIHVDGKHTQALSALQIVPLLIDSRAPAQTKLSHPEEERQGSQGVVSS